MDFDRIEGFGEHRSELRNGILCSLIANVKRDDRTKPEPWKADDFMVQVTKPDEKQLTPQEIERELDRIFGT